MVTISIRQARRLALAKAGLMKPEWTGLNGFSQKRYPQKLLSSVHQIIDRFGYLQLDTVAIAGARSHAIVLLSRLDHLQPGQAESLLKPGEPLFEYWGHEACWLPMSLYPVFKFRRQAFKSHPWWGDLISAHPQITNRLLQRIDKDGPLKSLDLEDPAEASSKSSGGWWNHKLSKKVATALWSSGQLAISERVNFQRVFDLPERVISSKLLSQNIPYQDALKILLQQALVGHGWATTGTLAQTWRLKNMQSEIKLSLQELAEQGEIMVCCLREGKNQTAGWICPSDLELCARLDRLRPRSEEGILLSPFDPVLWDRKRVAQLFNFEQRLEIFIPAEKRTYGYYCLPVLAGEFLIARVDLKADQKNRKLNVLFCRYESTRNATSNSAQEVMAVMSALQRFASQLSLELSGI